MARVIHSKKGFLRYMQMSKAAVFAFVEGKNIDPFFYGKICSSICNQRQLAYELRKANQISPNAGGKPALLEYHDYLRGRKALKTTLGGKCTIAVFFLDKDIDDISRQLRRSSHIIYTRYYDVHNEIFLNGDLAQACAAASSLDPAKLKPLLSNPRQWCAQAAERWRDWVILCVIAALNGVRHQCNYRVVSKVQCSQTGYVDAAKLALMKVEIASRMNLSNTEFESLHLSVSKRIGKLYASGMQDIVFKGKWYPVLLDEDVRRLMGATEYNRAGFLSRVTSAVASTLRFTGHWTQHYSSRLSELIDHL